ncbi:membrane-associated phosphatidylinositol transfer protein 1 [Protopterus annectens]|uniref:membrane-associated phosphatidylinositol transfer protein 1 n=1 Tax=Protopterus annectens TaxID=7888 RepID=UPI001CFBDD3A|nr:membrane-associated phosphatidylinositol transfer protein 1 [Protopterus annectens]
MLIKEYRIPLPMSLEEYQVAQLYMIQKKSREESSGEGSGVEILANRPYTDGPGGCGQYTHKIYHVGSHIPSWFRALLPKAALQVEEESWNAYPYTRTRYTCPFVEKFSIDIETYYKPDSGDLSNVFNLTSAEKRQRIVDVLDLVRDPISPNEYKPEEDPKLYRSIKTGRGPLNEEWLEEAKRSSCWAPIMCAYKLCKVEFRYWGMQSKIEQFIHDVGLRKVMLRAHRQAWCWQDEWCDLSMEDIRQLEEETARMLAQKMAKFAEPSQAEMAPASPEVSDRSSNLLEAGNKPVDQNGREANTPEDGLTKQWSTSSRSSHSSQHAGGVSPQSFSEWRMQNIARDSENSSEDEFFDAHEDFSDSDEVFSKEITKWNSSDFIDKFETVGENEESQGDLPRVRRTFSREGLRTAAAFPESGSMESVSEGCKIHVLILILHGGNILDKSGGDLNSKQGDLQTLSSVFDTVMRLHFPEALGHIALRLVPCPPVCAEAYSLVSNLSPYSYDGDCLSSSQDHIPLAALPLLATSSLHYQDAVSMVITRANQVYHDFLRSKEGMAFRGQVVLIGDCVGGILGFDALCHTGLAGPGSRESSRRGSMNDLLSPGIYIGKDPLCDTSSDSSRCVSRSNADVSCGGADTEQQLARKRSDTSSHEMDSVKQHQAFLSSLQASVIKGDSENRRTSSSSTVEGEWAGKLDFEVTDFFLFGSPLGLVLALRKTVMPTLDVSQCRPACQQIYNLFHSADPSASRLEPLLCKIFHAVPPFSIPRYQKYPLGDGNTALLADAVQAHASLFVDDLEVAPVTTPGVGFAGFWRTSEVNASSDVTGQTGNNNEIVKTIEKWWGIKRTDYALYCPDALTAFPTVTLPHLFHASYWESTDVVAFMLRQFIHHESKAPSSYEEASIYSPPIPQEKWQRKRTQVKIRNVTANHRANDAIVLEGGAQVLSGRFMYGPLDVVTLTGEKVDIYVMSQPPGGKWIHFGTELTNNSGRISFVIPEEKRLGIGMYPVRMVVRGDHTYSECSLTVVSPGTECVVFSIDGSFAASVSIMGSDPKVRAGAVDIVRHWQDLGYIIVYVTGRPDMQKQKVVAWLAQHNFPHGVVSFCDGLTHDPLRQKAAFLQSLIQEAEMKIEAAYGSAKDVSVYSSLGLAPNQVYIVGRPSKKFQNHCQFLSEGYVAHLAQLEITKHSHASKSSSRFVMGKVSFGRPVQTEFLRKQSQLFRSRHPTAPDRSASQLEKDGETCSGSGSGSSVKYKSRSVSLKLDNDV